MAQSSQAEASREAARCQAADPWEVATHRLQAIIARFCILASTCWVTSMLHKMYLSIWAISCRLCKQCVLVIDQGNAL